MARNRIEIVITAKDQASRALKGIGGNLQQLGKVALIGGAAVGAAVIGIGAGLAKLALDAAPIADLQLAFEGFTASIAGGADAMLAALQRSSSGLIANRDLMKSFNTATQLVSKDFAERLPEALETLGKVAASTGQDLDFLLSSLVTGVGRLSPMILDNLGIQIDLVAAQEAYAASIGKSVDELSKQEQQTALMNQVMEKLIANTADLPDVSESAASQLARLGATMQNVKDEIGIALLPIMTALIRDGLLPIVNRVGPALVNIMQNKLVPAFRVVRAFVLIFFRTLESSKSVFIAFNVAAVNATNGIVDLSSVIVPVTKILRFLEETVAPLAASLFNAVKSVVSFKDILVLLAIAISTQIIPFLGSLALAFAPLLATIIAGTVAIAALRKAWESDFLGIQGIVSTAIFRISEAFGELVRAVGFAISVFKEEGLVAALRTLFGTFEDGSSFIENFLRALGLSEGVVQAVEGIFRILTNFIFDTLVPAFQRVKEFVEDKLVPAFLKGVDSVKTWVDEMGGVPGILDAAIKSAQNLVNIVSILALDTLVKASEGARTFLKGVRDLADALKGRLLDILKNNARALGFVAVGLGLVAGVIIGFKLISLIQRLATATALLTAAGMLPLIPPLLIIVGLTAAAATNAGGFGDKLEDLRNFLLRAADSAKDLSTQLGILITELGGRAVRAIQDFVGQGLVGMLSDVVVFVGQLIPGFGTLKDSINFVSDAISRLVGLLPSIDISLPSFLRSDSPTPLEMGFRGIKDAISEVNREMANFGNVTAGLPNLAGADAGGGGVGGGALGGTINNFTITIQAMPGATVEDGRNAGKGFLEALRDEGHDI